MHVKPATEMSDEEILQEISMLRDRRSQRREAAAVGHTTRKSGEPKAKREKKIDPGLSDVLGQILLGGDDAIDAFNVMTGAAAPEDTLDADDTPTT